MILTKKSSDTINILKCLLCIGIVFIHVYIRPGESKLLLGSSWKLGESYQNFVFFQHVFIDLFLNHVCVPLFFCISGFLYFLSAPPKFSFYWFINKWKSRMKSLLIPYLIANAIFIVVIEFYMILYEGKSFDLNLLISGFWALDNGNPANPPLWFLRDLMIAIILSPLIYSSIKKTLWLLPLILGLVWVLNKEMSLNLWMIDACFFFSLGACLSIKEIDLLSLFTKSFLWYFIIYIVLLGIYLIYSYTLLLRISVFFGFALFISVSKQIEKRGGDAFILREKKFVVITFFIYLFHIYIAGFMWRPFCLILGTSETSLFFSYFGGALTTIIILYYIFVLLNYFLPKLTTLLIGSRY